MKKLSVVFIILLCINISSFAQVEDVAKEVLKAYQSRDVALLKKNASGMMKMAITDTFFDDSSIQEDLAVIDSWNGSLIETRYDAGDMMGSKVYIASIYFAEVPNNENAIYLVILSSMDKTNWTMFGAGVVSEKRAEFIKMSLTIPTEKETAPMAEEVTSFTTSPRNVSLEMYDGDSFTDATNKEITKSFNTLSSDNFFISLTHKDDYIQVAFSDKGYALDYKDSKGHFEAIEYTEKDTALQVLIDYRAGNDSWKKDFTWTPLDY